MKDHNKQLRHYAAGLVSIRQYQRSLSRKCNIRTAIVIILTSYATVAFFSFPRIILRSIPAEETAESLRLNSTKELAVKRWYLTNVTLRHSLAFQGDLPTRHVWPEDQPRNDRIEEQLLMHPRAMTPPKGNKLILLNIHGDRTKPAVGRSVFVKSSCAVSACQITYNFSRAKDAAALVFKDRVNPILLDRQAYKRPSDQIWILSLLESPLYTPNFSALDGQINWTATFRVDSELVTPYEKFVLYDVNRQWRKQAINYAEQKSGKGKVAWFVSNCETPNDRISYVKELAKYIHVDVFGTCGSKKCDRDSKKCLNLLRHDYKFYLSFENSNCEWYITEKLWIALKNDILPIVMGAPREDYEVIAPYKSFIHVSDFSDPKTLAEHLLKLDKSDEEYNAYFRWKGTGEFIDTRFYCRLCALLHADDMPVKTYHSLQNWWSGPGVCSS